MDGILNIDKVLGITSMDVVRQVKRITSQRHTGHAGTLDPEASGVLPICLGQATRLMEYVVDGEKEYLATIRLGVSTDTYDSAGQVVDEQDASGVTRSEVEATLASMQGTIQQTPPMFSALKSNGKRLHELARAGIKIEIAPRTVEVLKLALIKWEPPLVTVTIHCKRGFYVRSLANDLGQVLGCGAHLAGLRRISTGPFHLDQAVTVEKVKAARDDNTLDSLLFPADYVVLKLNSVTLDAKEEKQVRNGQAVPLSPRTHYAPHLQQCRAYGPDDRFVALVRFNRSVKMWQPFKVFQIGKPSSYSQENPLI